MFLVIVAKIGIMVTREIATLVPENASNVYSTLRVNIVNIAKPDFMEMPSVMFAKNAIVTCLVRIRKKGTVIDTPEVAIVCQM